MIGHNDRSSGPLHGGDLAWASRVFGQPPEGWQDLSTGISPWAYPAPPVPAEIWQRLPERSDALSLAAGRYYGVPPAALTALPGSQYGVARLPALLPQGRVAVPEAGYSEHRRAWQKAGHRLIHYRDCAHLHELVADRAVEHLVVINPNNPTGELITRPALEALYRLHAGRGAMLVDEAFMDTFAALDSTLDSTTDAPSSLASMAAHQPDLWVLRSVGKFFGLAGVRLGFLLGRDSSLVSDLKSELGPWAISHPAQWLGVQALEDRHWQAQQRRRLQGGAEALYEQWQRLLQERGLAGDVSLANGGLFVTLACRANPRVGASLEGLYRHLGRAGVLLRWCHLPAEGGRVWLRCGLPPDGGLKLAQALQSLPPGALHAK